MKEGCSFVWYAESSREPPSGLTPRSRYKHAACVSDCRVYIFGGKDGNLPLKDLWRFDLNTRSWELLKWTGDRLPNLQEHSLIAYQNKIYIFGGNFQFGADSDIPFWILNLGTMVCRKQSAAAGTSPEGRRGHTAVVFKDFMYIFAGFIDMRRSSSELWSYDLKLEHWSLLKPSDGIVPVGRHSHSAAIYCHFMCVYGGLADLEPKDDLWLWDFIANRWTRLKPSPGPPSLEGHSACVTRNLMIIFGGSHEGILQNDLWAFDFDLEVWQKLACKGIEQSPCSKHAALLLAHGDWCSQPSCNNSTTNLRRAASCPLSSVVMTQRSTRLTSSTRVASEKNYSKFGCSGKDTKSQDLQNRETNGARSENIGEPVALTENILYSPSAELEAYPLISDSDVVQCPSLGITNPAASELLESCRVPVFSEEPSGCLPVFPDGKSRLSLSAGRDIHVPEDSEKVGDFTGNFNCCLRMDNVAVVASKVKRANNLLSEDSDSKTRHVLAVSLLGTPTKSRNSSNRSLPDDDFGKLESTFDPDSSFLVEMDCFGGETGLRCSRSGSSLILQDLESPEATENVSGQPMGYDNQCSPKIGKKSKRTKFQNMENSVTRSGIKEDMNYCYANKAVKEAWVSPSHSVTSVDLQTSSDDVVMETERMQFNNHSVNSNLLLANHRPLCCVELFEAKSQSHSHCPDFSMFVFGGRSVTGASNFEVRTISVSRLEINLGQLPGS